MADDNIVLEHLRHIRSKVDRIDERQDLMQDDLNSMKHHLSGFMSQEARQDEEIAMLRNRLQRIEARLDIVDGEPH